MTFPITKRITASGTSTLANKSCTISQIILSCPNGGTSWVLKIKDKAVAPNTWVTPITLAVPTDGKPTVLNFTFPMYFEGGIDVITTGTPGEVSVQII